MATDKPLPESYESTGHLAVGLQKSVAEILRAIALLDLAPSYYQNGVPFYDSDARKSLVDHFFNGGLLRQLERLV